MRASDIDVRESPIHGRGVFANRRFRRGERVLPIDDRRVVTAENPLDPVQRVPFTVLTYVLGSQQWLIWRSGVCMRMSPSPR